MMKCMINKKYIFGEITTGCRQFYPGVKKS